MRTRNKYYINNQEVDVSTYSIQVAKGIPGEYRIKTEYDDSEESIITEIDRIRDKIDNLECQMYSNVNYNLDRIRNSFRRLIELLENELPEESRYKLNDIKYELN